MRTDPEGAGPLEESDEELLVGSAARAERFSVFYRRHAAEMLAFFARRTLDAQTAADLTAETFAAAFAARSRFREQGAGSAAAWLYTIGRRQLAHYWRHRRVQGKARERLGLPALALAGDDIARIEALIDFAALGRAVSVALTRLKSEQREALTLRVVEGRSYAEVARSLGCSEEVARARVSRGLKRLAAELES
jgi:RNA polymerase sigma factor (sigma-70 family)